MIQQSDIPLHRLRRWATARDRGEQTLIPLQGILNTVVRRTGFFPSAAVGGITPPPLTGEYYRLLRLQSSTFRITGGGGGSATSSSGREATLPGIMGGGSAASSWGSLASRIYEGVAAPPPRGRGVAAPTPRGEAVLPGITEGVAAPPPRGNYGGGARSLSVWNCGRGGSATFSRPPPGQGPWGGEDWKTPQFTRDMVPPVTCGSRLGFVSTPTAGNFFFPEARDASSGRGCVSDTSQDFNGRYSMRQVS